MDYNGAAYERVGATDSCVLPYGPGRVPELRYGMYGTDFAGFGQIGRASGRERV